jgi:hypothetical protein
MAKDRICNANNHSNNKCHESTTSQLVVGHADPAFRDLGENTTSQIIGVTHGSKNFVQKEEA